MRDTMRATQIIVQAVLWYNPVKLFLLLAFVAAGVSFVAAAVAVWANQYMIVLLLVWAGLMSAVLLFSLGALGYIIRAGSLQNGRTSEGPGGDAGQRRS
jgi:hypothetical protein